MSRQCEEGKFICDVCKGIFDIYPYVPESLVVKSKTEGTFVYPDVCVDCETKITEYINTIKVV